MWSPAKEDCRSDAVSATSVLRTRIAPTPSGYLHWGNAFSFVLTWLIAKKSHGQIVLRIDDLDAARARPEYVEDIFESLDWLGLDYDLGPSGPDDYRRNYSQILRLEVYRAALDELSRQGKTFACKCTRRSIQRSSGGSHPPECKSRGLPLDEEGSALRVSTTAQSVIQWKDIDNKRRSVDLHQEMRDFVVRRKDDVPAYQVTSLVDDLHFGINFIVRGEDLIASTGAQVFLAHQISANRFPQTRFLHHPLVADEAGKKLSKSSGASSLRALRVDHKTPEYLFAKLSPFFGIEERATTANDLLSMLPKNFLSATV